MIVCNAQYVADIKLTWNKAAMPVLRALGKYRYLGRMADEPTQVDNDLLCIRWATASLLTKCMMDRDNTLE